MIAASIARKAVPATASTASASLSSPRKSRSFPEHDLPSPIKFGHKLYVIRPAQPGVDPKVLHDAGKGAIGTPGVSYDGRSIYLPMAKEGDGFFHIYRLSADGGQPKQLTDGPFHDIDPAELPDGRIVFTSTRIGTFEEYHNPPSRALFVMNADGSDIHPITNTIIFDNEPRVMADGRIIFVRSDNFFDRGKVETLLHAVHPDGTEGYTEFGLDVAPDYGNRLRAFYCGSPAPLPDGRVAFASGSGITVARPGSASKDWQNLPVEAGDVSALPDGRLLCTIPKHIIRETIIGKQKRTSTDLSYQRICVVDPTGPDRRPMLLYESAEAPLHSPVYLGERPRPPLLAEKVNRKKADDVRATGVLFCQDARFTQNTTAGWSHVRSIRVIAGKGLNVRSSHSYIVHAGNETVELGTVPIAPDGSFAIEVPADTPIAFQAVDAEGRSELNEMSWIYVRPGETRGCLGCHHTRQATPPYDAKKPQALHGKPLKLIGQGQPHRFRGNNPAVTGLMELQFDRFREVAGLNRHSETANPLATGQQEVEALVAQLKGDDEGLAISAAQRLGIFREQAAAPALAECLREKNRELQVAAAIALGSCGTRESVTPLLNAMDYAEPIVAQAAAIALENLTAHAENFDPYARADQREAQARAWRKWFADKNWDTIELDLVRRLDSADRDIVRRAAVALGHTGGNAARAALREYVIRHREDNPFPVWIKTHQSDSVQFNSLDKVNPRTLQAAVRHWVT